EYPPPPKFSLRENLGGGGYSFGSYSDFFSPSDISRRGRLRGGWEILGVIYLSSLLFMTLLELF
ncbi:hypothetical protein J7K44_03240, partial [bacterium]|nr:hypothetical protein [bacterium]